MMNDVYHDLTADVLTYHVRKKLPEHFTGTSVSVPASDVIFPQTYYAS